MVKKPDISERWIWPFELLEKIGEGAMGVVYRARSVTNNRHVALKLLPPEFANDPTLAARFEREMEVLKTLKHPSIVHCFGGTCEGKRRFYAMELVEGGSLYHVIRQQGRLTWEQTVEYGLQMCAALGYAHRHGVTHRDVKPSNFLLTKEGKLKLSDFGLAYVGSATKLTAAGKTMGTYQYMAPEQIRGKDTISGPTDLYALGCVLFEMLTGRPPFLGDTPAEILQKHLEAIPPRVSEFVSDLPDPMLADMLIARMMDKVIERRPQTALEIAEILENSVRGPARAAGVLKPASRKPPLGETAPTVKTFESIKRQLGKQQSWLLAACAVLLVVMFSWNLWLRGAGSGSPAGGGLSRAERLWIDSLDSSEPAIKLAAARALGEIGREKPSEEIVQALIVCLNDSRPTVRTACVEALGQIGEPARSAISPLVKVNRQDSVQTVRAKAGEALERIRGKQAAVP